MNQLLIDLGAAQDKDEIISILQKIQETFLKSYCLKIKDFTVYPIEVESYYYRRNQFEDTSVHGHNLQKNRFGKLYFHRVPGRDNNTIKKPPRSGMDVCLSNDANFVYGLLIRIGKIVRHNITNSAAGPSLLSNQIFKLISEGDEINWDMVTDFEHKSDNILSKEVNPFLSKIYHLPRVGIDANNHPDYYALYLRSCMDLSLVKHKGDDVISIMVSQKIPPTAENIITLFGRNSTRIKNKVNF